nr:SUMF1/EgtB/PvdO family nonheme iron enzyme [Thermoanaerobaculia bacterium]
LIGALVFAVARPFYVAQAEEVVHAVLVLDGGAIPERRGEFFERCLAVLLRQWGEAEGRAEPALPLEAARRLLKPLAWELHRAGRQDGLSLVEVADKLDVQGRSEAPGEVLEWLHREAGLLQPTGSYEYGFSHLALQEFLAALEVGDRRAELLPELAPLWAESWWREVILLVASAGGSAQFGELVAVLLGPSLLEREEGRALLRDCLAEAAEVELAPFLALLDGDAEPRHKADVLRLLLGRREPALLERARVLSSSDHEDLKALCLRLLEQALRERSSGGEPCEVLVLLPRPEGSASELLAGVQACRRKLRVVRADGAWQGQLQQIQAETREVWLAVAQGHPSPWSEKLERTLLGILARDECRLVVVGQPGEGLPEGWPQGLPAPERPAEPPWLERRAPPPPPLARAKAERSQPTPGQPWTEPTTDIRFLWVPPGEFSMGSNEIGDHERPAHRVKLSGFWLGETPVTNRQYGLYLEAAQGKVEEPLYWRDRRFSNLEQPVVGVSWEEARAFCRWLAGLARQPVELPTEAQWEYAARGAEGRKYPWGNQPGPNPQLARYAQDSKTGSPAVVGSYPAGAGPFGHLDLAGNVWEWCLDLWNAAAYKGRKGVAENRVETRGDAEVRALRGGGWWSSAELLQSACRGGSPAWHRRGLIGFRVAVSPPSR